MDEDVFGGFVCDFDLDDLDGLGTAAAPARKKVPEQAETKTGVLCQEQGCTLRGACRRSPFQPCPAQAAPGLLQAVCAMLRSAARQYACCCRQPRFNTVLLQQAQWIGMPPLSSSRTQHSVALGRLSLMMTSWGQTGQRQQHRLLQPAQWRQQQGRRRLACRAASRSSRSISRGMRQQDSWTLQAARDLLGERRTLLVQTALTGTVALHGSILALMPWLAGRLLRCRTPCMFPSPPKPACKLPQHTAHLHSTTVPLTCCCHTVHVVVQRPSVHRTRAAHRAHPQRPHPRPKRGPATPATSPEGPHPTPQPHEEPHCTHQRPATQEPPEPEESQGPRPGWQSCRGQEPLRPEQPHAAGRAPAAAAAAQEPPGRPQPSQEQQWRGRQGTGHQPRLSSCS